MYIKALITAICLTATLSAAAQTVLTDTIVGIYDPSNVTVVTKSDGRQIVTISIIDNADDQNLSADTGMLPSFFDLTKPKRWNLDKLFTKKPRNNNRNIVDTEGLKGLYAGGIIPMGEDSPIKNGWEIGLSSLIRGEWSAGWNRPSVSIGAGFGWEILNMDRGCILEKVNGRLLVATAPEGSRKINSRIKNFHFTVPLTLNLPMGGSFGLSLTGELHLNTYTTASSSWRTENGNKVSYSLKGLHQRIATIDMKACLGWFNEIGVYVKYSPMDKWMDGYGPEYKTLSVGASFNF